MCINKAWRDIPTFYIDTRRAIGHRKRTMLSDSTNTVINNQDILVAFHGTHGESRLARHTDDVGMFNQERAFSLVPWSLDDHFDRSDCGMRVLRNKRHVITFFVVIHVRVVRG